MKRSLSSLAGLVLVAAGLTAGIDEILRARVHDGSDHALRLAAILPYVGVDSAYTLARALGSSALVFAYATVALGLETSRRRRTSRAIPQGVALVHRQMALLTLAMVAAHITVPFSSVYEPYGGWVTTLVPWGQPVSWGIKAATWQSFGIVAFYLTILTGPTYYVLRSRYRAWALAHRLAVGTYGLSVAHAFLLGTDFLVSGPLRVLLLALQVPLAALLALRVAHPFARLLAITLTIGVATLTAVVWSGAWAGGRQL